MIRTDFSMFVKNLSSKSFTQKYFSEIGREKAAPQRSIENSLQSVFATAGSFPNEGLHLSRGHSKIFLPRPYTPRFF